MQVIFSRNNLERCYTDEDSAQRAWGSQVTHRYALHIGLVHAIRIFDELRTFQVLHLHPPKGQRAGEQAMTLHGRWRLIVEAQKGDRILVKEVSNHYGD